MCVMFLMAPWTELRSLLSKLSVCSRHVSAALVCHVSNSMWWRHSNHLHPSPYPHIYETWSCERKAFPNHPVGKCISQSTVLWLKYIFFYCLNWSPASAGELLKPMGTPESWILSFKPGAGPERLSHDPRVGTFTFNPNSPGRERE